MFSIAQSSGHDRVDAFADCLGRSRGSEAFGGARLARQTSQADGLVQYVSYSLAGERASKGCFREINTGPFHVCVRLFALKGHCRLIFFQPITSTGSEMEDYNTK